MRDMVCRDSEWLVKVTVYYDSPTYDSGLDSLLIHQFEFLLIFISYVLCHLTVSIWVRNLSEDGDVEPHPGPQKKGVSNTHGKMLAHPAVKSFATAIYNADKEKEAMFKEKITKLKADPSVPWRHSGTLVKKDLRTNYEKQVQTYPEGLSLMKDRSTGFKRLPKEPIGTMAPNCASSSKLQVPAYAFSIMKGLSEVKRKRKTEGVDRCVEKVELRRQAQTELRTRLTRYGITKSERGPLGGRSLSELAKNPSVRSLDELNARSQDQMDQEANSEIVANPLKNEANISKHGPKGPQSAEAKRRKWQRKRLNKKKRRSSGVEDDDTYAKKHGATAKSKARLLQAACAAV